MITSDLFSRKKLLSVGAVPLLILGFATISPTAFAADADDSASGTNNPTIDAEDSAIEADAPAIEADVPAIEADVPAIEADDPIIDAEDIPESTPEQAESTTSLGQGSSAAIPDAEEEPSGVISALLAAYPEPALTPASVTTDVRQSAAVTLTVTGLGDVPDDQVLLLQLNPAGGSWETLETTTVGAIKAAGSSVSIPRDTLQDVNLYYVQLSNWGVDPDYYEVLITPQATISVVELPMPSLVQTDFLVDQASPTDVVLQLNDYQSYPGDQAFTVNIGQAGTGWQLVTQLTVAQLLANHGNITIPALNFTEPGSYNIEVTNWGLSDNYHPDLIQLGAGILVGDVSAPTLVESQLFLNEADPPTSATVTLTNLNTAVPDDQVINVQYGPRGEGDGWLPVAQLTMGELRAAGGEIIISGDMIAAAGLYDVEITNWGMSPNYFPEIFIRYAEITVGQFPPPQFVDDLTHTYLDSTTDIPLPLEELADLPDAQAFNLQIGLSGSTSGWQDVETVTLGELRESGGIVTVPRSFLSELGVYHVQLTNWGMSPNYYPEIFTTGTAISVVATPLLSFTDGDGETITAQEATAGADTTVNVLLTGYVPAGAELNIVVMDGSSVVYASPISATVEQSATGSYSFVIPGEHLNATYGEPSPILTVVASLALPAQFAGATVAPAELDLTVVAEAPGQEPPAQEPPDSSTPKPRELATAGVNALILFLSALTLTGAGLIVRRLTTR